MRVLECKLCGTALSTKLTFVDGNNPDVRLPEFPDEENAIESGLVYKVRDHAIKDGMKARFLMNADDLTNQVEWGGNITGCCGPSGTDGPNRVCVCCNTFIGTESRDCWTGYFFWPNLETTLWNVVED